MAPVSCTKHGLHEKGKDNGSLKKKNIKKTSTQGISI